MELKVVLLLDGVHELLGLVLADVEGAEALEQHVHLEVDLVQRGLGAVALDGLVEGLVAVLDLVRARLAQRQRVVGVRLGGIGVGADLVHVKRDELPVLELVPPRPLGVRGAGEEAHHEERGQPSCRQPHRRGARSEPLRDGE